MGRCLSVDRRARCTDPTGEPQNNVAVGQQRFKTDDKDGRARAPAPGAESWLATLTLGFWRMGGGACCGVIIPQ